MTILNMASTAGLMAHAGRVLAHRQAGADHVCLHIVGAGSGMPLPEERELATLAS
ncbi:hypothetical protein [Rugosimonospora africana]|uniref:Uncharacterized protein n=1 Tax=Rugosimonospora africana TaxID=556532 RepID=A0A8J3QXY1_9ACTN|nr:hypothetical protein [Rugosimonospora africana]GIH18918.1 hypothetical protein Raf01_70900 [Rugosimonospora africana]